MELKQVGERTFCLLNATNIGIYQINDTDVYLIDTGNDKDCGKKIIKMVEEQGWKIKGILNTHSHADHIGGNQVIQNRLEVPVFAHGLENLFINQPILEPMVLYGSEPFSALQNKFLQAHPSHALEIKDQQIEGIQYFPLKGHCFDMIGFETSDHVFFLGDALFSEETILKYHFFYLSNVKEFLHTLDFLKTLEGTCFIPSHGLPTTDIHSLIDYNEQEVFQNIQFLLDLCQTGITFEEILQKSFTAYHLEMNLNQYVLVGSTLKAYLTYLVEEGKIEYHFSQNQMIWQTV